MLLLPKDLPATPFRRLLRLSDQLGSAHYHHDCAKTRRFPAAQHDVLAMLLAARDEDGTALSDEELIGQASVIFLRAGHETSSNALT
ncbi:MAG: hypothetical protein U0074_02680 [Kouleothrix sp.]